MIAALAAAAWVGAILGVLLGAALAFPAGVARGRRRPRKGGQVLVANAPRPQPQRRIPGPPPRGTAVTPVDRWRDYPPGPPPGMPTRGTTSGAGQARGR